MKHLIIRASKPATVFIACIFLFSFFRNPVHNNADINFRFPYKDAGLTERQAAAHLLSRFTFGATQGQVDEVVKTGLEKWFAEQLKGGIADDSLDVRLAGYDALKMTNAQATEVYPRPIHLLRMAREDGIIPKDSATDLERKEFKKQLGAYVKQKNFRRQSELFRQFISYKILRATYSNNQLQEVLTDFWFNHFNVSLTKRDCSLYIPAYERDVIRPNVTGKFEDLLIATAKSPAMLLYLDNFNSVASRNDSEVADERLRRRLQRMDEGMKDSSSEEMIQRIQQRRKNQGLNENYAREVMELHTMGVDGGYTQSDVTQAAKILTGWTLYPLENSYGRGLKNMIDKIGEDKLTERGFVHDGDFLFAMNNHDKGEKKVLGKVFPANGGYQEGITLLKMLAHHPSTATFICKKLAVHFVNDNPPNSLVEKMAKTFTEKDGDIKAVLITMVCSPEFWDKAAVREKTKSPFELAISTVRALHANIQQPYQLFTWMDKMGQKIYYFQAPTGFPDKAQYWINTGALLNRMNFGLATTSKQIRGLGVDLLSLNNYHEPESPSAALLTYGKLLMPERDLSGTIKRLTPMLTQQSLEKKIENAADMPASKNEGVTDKNEDAVVEEVMKENERPAGENNKMDTDSKNMLAQVVGIIIGSPEFQRK